MLDKFLKNIKEEADVMEITVDEYNASFPSLSDEHAALKKAGYFLPDRSFCSRYYLRGIMTGDQ